MNKQEELFYEWRNLKEEIQSMAIITQNPLDQSGITSTDLAEWKTRCIRFEDIYARLKQNTEEFITICLTQPSRD